MQIRSRRDNGTAICYVSSKEKFLLDLAFLSTVNSKSMWPTCIAASLQYSLFICSRLTSSSHGVLLSIRCHSALKDRLDL